MKKLTLVLSMLVVFMTLASSFNQPVIPTANGAALICDAETLYQLSLAVGEISANCAEANCPFNPEGFYECCAEFAAGIPIYDCAQAVINWCNEGADACGNM